MREYPTSWQAPCPDCGQVFVLAGTRLDLFPKHTKPGMRDAPCGGSGKTCYVPGYSPRASRPRHGPGAE